MRSPAALGHILASALLLGARLPRVGTTAAALGGALAAALLLGAQARGEMYRCTGPGGEPIFTSDASACPGAKPHEPRREVQRAPTIPGWSGDPALAADGPGRADRGAPPAALATDSEDAQAAMWRRKRTQAQEELRGLERGESELREIVSWCNRGGELVVEDEVGLRDRYDCSDARDAYERASARLRELRAYLAGGLDDECRRAGCLPGWVRE
ncbi:MAG TPA: hypothetical protein VHQ66_02300 [Myxococcota bacterium]|nr:hypothetical protein [Myxococcota bacterium]